MIHNPLFQPLSPRSRAERDRLRAKLGLPSSAPVVLHVGAEVHAHDGVAGRRGEACLAGSELEHAAAAHEALA